MVYIYPTKIQTTTGHSVQHATQKITNPSNLCSDNNNLAYWGIKTPTYVGNYLRNYYDSITTISGSYYKPETIYATKWDTGNIDEKATVNKITIEYKWEQISYSCGTMDCYGRFDKPKITLIAKGKNLTSFYGAKPDAIRYNNSNANSTKNTNSANLATLHSHKNIDISKYNLTIADLENLKIKFDPAKNTYSNHCRIVMQFIRIKVDYTNPTASSFLPCYQIIKSTITPTEPKLLETGESEPYTYKCTIKSTIPYTKETNCTVLPITDDVIIDQNSIKCTPTGSTYNKDTGKWEVKKFTNQQATLSFKAISKKTGTKKIQATINRYADTIDYYRKAINEVNVINQPNNVDWNIEIEGLEQPYIFDAKNKSLNKCLKISIKRDQDQNDRNEVITIDTDGWITENVWQVSGVNNPISITQTSNGIWKFSNINGTDIDIKTRDGANCIPIPAGEYNITATHTENKRLSETKTINVYVTDTSLPMDTFKLRLEDGSDVRYNSLAFTMGDDLIKPLTYELDENDIIDGITLTGETKRIPKDEAKYISYKIDSQYDIENALCKIEVIDTETGEDCSDIIIGCDNQAHIFNGETNKFCTISKIKKDEQQTIKFIVQAPTETIYKFKLLFLNYDEYETQKWTPCYIYVQNVPSVKLSIESDKDELTTPDNDEVTIYYNIENKSNIDGKNLKFQIKEPRSFEIKEYEIYHNNIEGVTLPHFNTSSRVLTFTKLNGAEYKEALDEYISTQYTLKIKYKAKEKGIFDFKINTYDNTPSNYDDDQQTNSATKKILVNISSKTLIKTSVSKQRPYINELIDFKISVKNYLKEQKQFIFIIKDIGSYDQLHSQNDYTIEYTTYDKGMFVDGSAPGKIYISVDNDTIQQSDDTTIKATLINKNGNPIPNTEMKFYNDLGDSTQLISDNTNDNTITETENKTTNDSNKIGTWTVQNIKINENFELVVTLRPKELGYHVIETTMIDSDGQIQNFENFVNVLEEEKQIEFNTYHAVNTTDIECPKCTQLTEICDDDYININDELFYVCEVTNNSRNPIETTTHIYARLPENFLTNDVKCSSYNIEYTSNNLLHIRIPYIEACSTKKICFKIIATERGIFRTHFMLTNRSANVYHKDLIINVDDVYNQKTLEHEITIYNFEKTNRYFRYELDDNNTIFKFFNQGNDRSLRMVDVEDFEENSIETYKGSNLKKLVRDIAKNSIYFEPELLRVGNNKLTPKGYEVYPDGFIRRFGLLNSEVFHYTGQLPIISNLADKAMKWDQDTWDTKLWGGDIYDNGVFDLTIDYNKIPKNFNILEVDNPLKNLQAIVDKTKPYGTQAVCYYSTKLYMDLAIDLSLSESQSENIFDLPLKLKKNLGLISTYNRHDNSVAVYYDLFNCDLKTNIDYKVDVAHYEERNDSKELKTRPFNNLGMSTDVSLSVDVYDQQYQKQYISDCLDIVQNSYTYGSNVHNITIHKDYNYIGTNNRQNSFVLNDEIYSFYYEEPNTITINIENEKIDIKYIKDEMNKFIGFYIIKNDDEILFKTNFYTNINVYNIQIQKCETSNQKVIHIFCSINNKPYTHIGYLYAKTFDNIIIQPNKFNSYSKTSEDTPVYFQISDNVKTIKKQPQQVIQFNNTKKWQNLKNIISNNSYAYIENNNNIDIECKNIHMETPPIALKYNNINIDKSDEIIDIGLRIKAKSNKGNFIRDLNIDLYDNGDSYIPLDNVASKNYYPSNVENVYNSYTNQITLQNPNITICSNCFKTSLGLYDECPHCQSNLVSHYKEKKDVTMCENCGWIVDGHNEYCTHCLSNDIIQTKVDFNKTYCRNCGKLMNEYSPICTKCLSTEVEHLNNDEIQYRIYDKSTQNIKPIIIKSDTNRVNICNIEFKTNIIKDELQNLKYLYLHIYGNNYNIGSFYYCSDCHTATLGESEKCPVCNKDVQQYNFDNTTMDIYYQIGNHIEKIDNDTTYDQIKNQYDIKIDIAELVQKTNTTTFKLLLYAENLVYDIINTTIEELDIDKDSYDLLVDNIPVMNISLDNIYYEYEYVNEQKWENINNLQGFDHKGIKYTNTNDTTDSLLFSDFGIQNDDYSHIYCTIVGLNQSDKHIKLNMTITDQNKQQTVYQIEKINPNLFNYTFDLLDILPTKPNELKKIEESKKDENIEDYEPDMISTQRIKDLNIQLYFDQTMPDTNIVITDLFLTTKKSQTKNLLHTDVQVSDNQIAYKDDVYFVSTKNMFGLKNIKPYFFDGRHLETNLVCYLDFGKLNNEEYIRLYDVEMVILYKNKYGKIATEYITTNDDIKYTKQLINGNIQKQNAESWGSVKTPMNILNNLESEIFNNSDEESLQFTPLKYELIQAFTPPINNIGEIELDYAGRVGYPSDFITVQIYDDYQNSPGNLLFEKDIPMPLTLDNIRISVDLDDISTSQYWFKLIDHNANENNYHRFNHNTHINKGNLIICDNPNNVKRDQNVVLSFNINSDNDIKTFYTLPTTLDIGDAIDFKTYHNLYRYNIKSTNNVYLRNYKMEIGYVYYEESESLEDVEDTVTIEAENEDQYEN